MSLAPKSKFSESEIDLLEKWGTIREDLMPRPGNEFYKSLEEYGSRQIERMQVALGLAGRVASKQLQQSITFDDIEIKDSEIRIQWSAEDYAKYIDQGVNGIERKFGSTYNFRRPPRVRTLGPASAFMQSILEWMKFRGIKTIKTKSGVKQIENMKERMSVAFVIMRSIQNKGIEPSYFIEDSFEQKDIAEQIDKIIQDVWQSQ